MIRLRRLAPLVRRAYSTAPPTPRQELARVADLQERLSGVTAHDEKRGTIAQYPDLRRLLEFVYHPKTRLHYTSARLARSPSLSPPRSRSAGEGCSGDPPIPATLLDLFRMLSSRTVTGSAADRLVSAFLSEHGILDSELQVFKQLLDRNLVSGFRSRTLESVKWPFSSDTWGPSPLTSSEPPSSPSQWSPTGSWDISVALGVPLRPPYEVAGRLASRKYDGVRVVTVIDFVDGEVRDVRFLSRQGNEFSSLAVLGELLRGLDLTPLDNRQRYAVQRFEGPNISLESPSSSSSKHRLVLDGEVCAMNGQREDFTATISQIRRHSEMPDPAYLVFDILTWTELQSQSGTRSLSERLGDLTTLLTSLGSSAVRAIEQTRVEDDAHLARLVAAAGEKGWEGLILRSDVGYRGKRTSDIAKIKSWSEAEYRVVARQTGRIFLAGRVQEACTSLIVEHRGHKVNVGSGLSTEQRLKYVDEKAVIGTTVTVQYFEETEKSLRFPTVKRVWDDTEDGGRAV